MSNPSIRNRYNDYLQVQANFHPVMTREAIDATPETWMEFFPHETYLNFLNALLEGVLGGTKSVWLYGNFGTGKSAAALVTQKLFLDDEERVVPFNADKPPGRQIDFITTGDVVQER